MKILMIQELDFASEFDKIKHKFDNIDARLDALEASTQDHDDTTD